MTKSRCEHCVFWKDSDYLTGGKSDGECYRYPPVLIPTLARDWEEASRINAWAYPSTGEDEWCGEFSDKRPA